jgi:GAF domain-containing protein
VDALVKLLKTGVGMREGQYFYSSGPGTAVAAGDDFVARIRTELVGCDLAIELITPSYLESRFCLCELGAVWVSTKANFPIRTPSVSSMDLDGVLGNIQAPEISHCLDDLAERVRDVLRVTFTVANWNRSKQEFLDDLETLLSQIPSGRYIPFEEYSRVTTLLAETEMRLGKSQEIFRKAVTLGDKLSYGLEYTPPLLLKLNEISVAPPQHRQHLVNELELTVVHFAYQLYGRSGLRAVVWHYVDGQFEPGRGRFGWGKPISAPDADRAIALKALLDDFDRVWVDDREKPEHSASLRFGSSDDSFPSFLLVPLIAGDRNLGFLEVGAPATLPLTEEDFRPVEIFAAVLACGLAIAGNPEAQTKGS